MSAEHNATVNFLQIIKWNRHFGADALSLQISNISWACSCEEDEKFGIFWVKSYQFLIFSSQKVGEQIFKAIL